MTRVADDEDEGAVLGNLVALLRPDPDRLDPWFLAGFLDADDNLAGASTGSTTVQVQPGRRRLPLLPLEEQRRYGEAFRRVRELRHAADQAADLARRSADVLTGGLTTGALEAPGGGQGSRPGLGPSVVRPARRPRGSELVPLLPAVPEPGQGLRQQRPALLVLQQ
ncbi:hypothetical protein ACIQ7Q_23625 [Streptomyces sp. NPDC096176]|uniref:hypothetical protein n=1 Tax=Streptomyces sp. NPDC096176 TaxID=3366079 RepID=UPI003811C7C4